MREEYLTLVLRFILSANESCVLGQLNVSF